jgi:hypothetical protein
LLARSVMSFILTDETTIVGTFSPNGFEMIKPGAPVKLVFDNHPGRIYHAQVVNIPRAVGQGQIRDRSPLQGCWRTSVGSAAPGHIRWKFPYPMTTIAPSSDWECPEP